LCCHVIRGDLKTTSSSPSPFEKVVGQEPHVRSDDFWLDVPECCVRARRLLGKEGNQTEKSADNDGESAHTLVRSGLYAPADARFGDRFRVLGLTRRGQRLSGKPTSGDDTETLVEELRRFLDGVGIKRVTSAAETMRPAARKKVGMALKIIAALGDVQTRRAHPEDAEAIALAHLDSIRSIGPTFYPPDVVEDWRAGISAAIYVKAMEDGEAFFIATGNIEGEPLVLGFSTHRIDDAHDGVSVYVRGRAARRGIGTTLLRLAEAHALAHGATSIQIQASFAGVEFYKANGFEEIGRGEALLMSGRSMPCVFMRKLIAAV
jgi:putative acetyltransferase